MFQNQSSDSHTNSKALAHTLRVYDNLSQFYKLLSEKDFKSCEKILKRVYGEDTKSLVSKLSYQLEKSKEESSRSYTVKQLYMNTNDLSYKFLYAKTLLKEGEERKALSELNELVEEVSLASSLLSRVFLEIAKIYMSKGDYEGAEEYLNRSYSIDSEAVSVLIAYAENELLRGNLENVKKRYEEVLIKYPSNTEAKIGLANLHAMLGNYEIACSNVKSILDENPIDKQALMLLYKWSESCEERESVVTFIEDYLKYRPTDDGVMALQIGWYIRKQNYKKAKSLLDNFRKYFQGSKKNIDRLEVQLREMI